MSDAPRLSEVRGGAGAGLSMVAALVILGLLLVCGIGGMAAIFIPNFVAMQLKAKRSEVPGNVNGIKTAELAYAAAYDGFVAVGSSEEAMAALPGKEQRDFELTADWITLGWRPDGPVRGAYWVTTDPEEGFVVHGVCDVDGDGVVAEYIATRTQNATQVTPDDVY